MPGRYLVITVTLASMLLPGAAPALASVAEREAALAEGWEPTSRRQPSSAPIQDAGFSIGRMRIPAIDLDEIVRAGVSLEVIDRGPAHWIGTALPGETGNVVLAGHRTTHTAPFLRLNELTTGDIVYVTDARGFEVMYRVTEQFVVRPDAIWITWDNGEPLLTMFACHPVGSAAQRIVVRAEMIAGRLIA